MITSLLLSTTAPSLTGTEYERVFPVERLGSTMSSGIANAAPFGMPTATSAPATVRKLSRKKRRRLVGTKQSLPSQASVDFSVLILSLIGLDTRRLFFPAHCAFEP